MLRKFFRQDGGGRFVVFHIRIELVKNERQIRMACQVIEIAGLLRQKLNDGAGLLRGFRPFVAIQMDDLRHVVVHKPGPQRIVRMARIPPAVFTEAVIYFWIRYRHPREEHRIIPHLRPIRRHVQIGRAFQRLKKIAARPWIRSEDIAGRDVHKQSRACRHLLAFDHHFAILIVSFGKQFIRQFVAITVLPGGKPREPHQAWFAVIAGFDAAAVPLVSDGSLHVADIFQHRHDERLPLLVRQIVVQPIVCHQCALPRIMIPFGQNTRPFRQFNELDGQLQPVVGFLQIFFIARAEIDQRAFQRLGAAVAFQTVSHGVLVADVAFEDHLAVDDIDDVRLVFQFNLFRKAVHFLF